MIRAGFETTHPSSGIHTRVVAGVEETEGRGWVLEIRIPAGAESYLPKHYHWTWTETFEVLEGTARCEVGDTSRTLKAGESVVFPPKVPHRHPENAGSGPLVYRQSTDFGGVDRTAVNDVIGVAATLNGLARDGKVNARGLPRNVLQFAATIRALTRHGGFDAKAPFVVQLGVAATLGRLAEALGYRGADPRYFASPPARESNVASD